RALGNVAREAQKFSYANTAGNVQLNLVANSSNNASGDIVCGYLSNPSDLSQQMDFTPYPNSVQVRVRRDSTANSPLSLWFARVAGVDSASMSAMATATFKDRITGFSIHTPGTSTCKLLPYALSIDTWNQVLAGNGPDLWSRDPNTGAVSSASDGIHECKLFPISNGNGSSKNSLPPGNFGTIDIGSPNNSSAVLVRQILYGPNAEDLSYYP